MSKQDDKRNSPSIRSWLGPAPAKPAELGPLSDAIAKFAEEKRGAVSTEYTAFEPRSMKALVALWTEFGNYRRALSCWEATDVYLNTWKAEVVTGSRHAAMKSFHSGASAVRTF